MAILGPGSVPDTAERADRVLQRRPLDE